MGFRMSGQLRFLLLTLLATKCWAQTSDGDVNATVPPLVEGAGAAAPGARSWLDPARSVSERVEALLKVMTTDQKVRNLGSDATTGGVPSLGVPSFVWQYECLHGMVNKGLGVMYPAPIAWAAGFDPQLTNTAASQIGDEMRAYNNKEMRSRRPPADTHCFGPHVGIVRDPRWGRLQETYGEGEAQIRPTQKGWGQARAGRSAACLCWQLTAGATCSCCRPYRLCMTVQLLRP
ncbi:hypothetical protein ABPG75_008224 [Micractinium tetrahymenae]